MTTFQTLDAISESNIVYRGFMVYIIKRRLFISVNPSQSKDMPSNGNKTFCSGRKNISLWMFEEKRTVTALERRDIPPLTTSAGGRTACWQGPSCPPARSPSSSSSAFINVSCSINKDSTLHITLHLEL